MPNEPTILYEDNDIFVLNKPSGMIVNNVDTAKDEMTVQDWIEKKNTSLRTMSVSNGEAISMSFLILTGLLRRVAPRNDVRKQTFEDPSITFVKRSGIVHRLDKETSGILLVAKNIASCINLQKQFKERTIKKIYTVLTHGKIFPAEGEINVPVGRLPFNRMRFGVVAGGREAVTKYKILRYYDTKILGEKKLTLVELYPQTGRTHQIRVHLKYLNHPVVADELYAGRKTARDDRKYVSRLFLHASKITFLHPSQNREISFESPLPEELQRFLKILENPQV